MSLGTSGKVVCLVLVVEVVGSGEVSGDSTHSSGFGSMEWKERGAAPLEANGSNGSSLSSVGLEHKPEFRVAARGKYDRSGVNGAAMAKLELAW